MALFCTAIKRFSYSLEVSSSGPGHLVYIFFTLLFEVSIQLVFFPHFWFLDFSNCFSVCPLLILLLPVFFLLCVFLESLNVRIYTILASPFLPSFLDTSHFSQVISHSHFFLFFGVYLFDEISSVEFGFDKFSCSSDILFS